MLLRAIVPFIIDEFRQELTWQILELSTFTVISSIRINFHSIALNIGTAADFGARLHRVLRRFRLTR